MNKLLLLSLLIGTSALADGGVDHAKPVSIAPVEVSSAGSVYGERMPSPMPAVVRIDDADVATHSDKPAAFSGRITEVCQKEGCWMMLEDDGQVARVMMHDHAFTIPKDATGRAEVQGVLSVKELSKEAAEHLAEDGNGVVPASRELRIDATGVRIEG